MCVYISRVIFESSRKMMMNCKGTDKITEILQDFPPVSLSEMGKVKLMNRIDTKYVTTEDSLAEFLRASSGDYFVEEINGIRNLPYSTTYFDTPDCNMFYEHERGRTVRQKIRMRIYEGTGNSFLEVKRKNNKGRTAKERIPAPYKDDILNYTEYIESHSAYEGDNLEPRIENHFRRITLVNRAMTERLTIDTGLWFHNIANGNDCSLEGLVIIELKRDGNVPSTATGLLHSLHIHPSGFSKYCIGMALTDSSLRQNRLKPRIRMVKRMLGLGY